ncbi:MAG: TetR/AcrR family transcriptional regulator, partial [Myxococcota bacterium]
GSLYQYFPNKDSLLADLLEEHHRQVHEVVGRGLDRLRDHATSLDDAIRSMLTDLLALHRADPALTKALSAATLRESPAAAELDQNTKHAGEHHLVVRVLASRPDVRRADHAVMAAVLAQTMAQLTRWLAHDAPADMDNTALVEETVQLLVRYLQRDGA